MNDYECLLKKYGELQEIVTSMSVDNRNYRHLQRTIQVCEASSRGIFKRIDENRELLEFLQKEAPELLERCPWITGWIAGNDHFFNDLVHALGSENIFSGVQRMHPRPWPGR